MNNYAQNWVRLGSYPQATAVFGRRCARWGSIPRASNSWRCGCES